MTSAIKVDGEALYKKAHRGEEIERKAREIEVYSVSLLSLEEKRLVFVAEVSKGTYLRTLGEDIAERLGTLGYLDSLRRTSIGTLTEEKMVSFDSLEEGVSLTSPLELISLKERVEADEEKAKKIKNGLPMYLNLASKKVLFTYCGTPLAVYYQTEEDPRFYKSERGLF